MSQNYGTTTLIFCRIVCLHRNDAHFHPPHFSLILYMQASVWTVNRHACVAWQFCQMKLCQRATLAVSSRKGAFIGAEQASDHDLFTHQGNLFLDDLCI